MLRRCVLLILLCVFLCACDDELTRQKAGDMIQDKFKNTDLVANVLDGKTGIGWDGSMLDRNYKSLQKLAQGGIIQMTNCINGWQIVCDVSITDSGSEFLVQNSIRNRLTIMQDPSSCMPDHKCDISTLQAATIELAEVTGISDSPVPGIKAVDFTFHTHLTKVGAALASNPPDLIRQAIFQKFDDGWRLVKGPF